MREFDFEKTDLALSAASIEANTLEEIKDSLRKKAIQYALEDPRNAESERVLIRGGDYEKAKKELFTGERFKKHEDDSVSLHQFKRSLNFYVGLVVNVLTGSRKGSITKSRAND